MKKHVGPDGPGISFLNIIVTDMSALWASEKIRFDISSDPESCNVCSIMKE
jgi:hypothetical protein